MISASEGSAAGSVPPSGGAETEPVLLSTSGAVDVSSVFNLDFPFSISELIF
jgi:hypothetical protein